MRRLILSLSLVVLGTAGAATPAAATSVICEAYCLLGASYCYSTVGPFIGIEKCDAYYEGCVAGCQAADADAKEQEEGLEGEK